MLTRAPRTGTALKPRARGEGPGSKLKERAKDLYIETWNGFDPSQVAAMTFVYEGASGRQVRRQQAEVLEECRAWGGARGDAESGRRGFFLTFMIAYLRDFGLSLGFLSESFESSVPWASVTSVCEAVKAEICQLAKAQGVKAEPLVGCRVSQAYDTCACVYIYVRLPPPPLPRQALALTRERSPLPPQRSSASCPRTWPGTTCACSP